MKAHYIPVGWYQLKHQKYRLLAAVAGIAFAVILMLVQQGFRSALFVSSVRWHEALQYELVLISPKTNNLLMAATFPRNRLMQVAGLAEVDTVTPVYLEQTDWRNPVDPANVRGIFVVGFDTEDAGFGAILNPEQHRQLRERDRFLFDALSRSEFGPVAEILARRGVLDVELSGRRVRIPGLFRVGTSFGIDGALLGSDLNFRRLFPHRSASHVSLGLVHLQADADPETVQQRIRDYLGGDVLVLTRAEFKQLEIDYWNYNTPIGFVFTFGVVMGFVVGAIIVYQILFADVQDHLREYATLKAIGHSNFFLGNIVVQQALILAVMGFLPGALLTFKLFDYAAAATNLPLQMNVAIAGKVLALTLIMCLASGAIATRKLRAADPADVF